MWPTLDALNAAARVFVLCDGMGGHEAGEVASQTVCETLGRSLQFNNEGLLTDAILQHGMENAYKALDARDTGGEKKMGTTMTMLALDAGGAVIAHLGDSRVYHFRPGATREDTIIMHRTEDHSLVNEMVRLGEMTEEEARVAPNKNVITRAMQPNMKRQCRADVFHQTDILPGDYFMLCSDGILEQFTDANLRFIFSEQGGDAANKVKIIREQTQDNSDNHTAFIIQITGVEGEPTPRPATNGAMYSLLAFPGGAAAAPATPAAPAAPATPAAPVATTPGQPTAPVTIKTVSSAGVMPQKKNQQNHAKNMNQWEARTPVQHRVPGMKYVKDIRRKSPVGAWVIAAACVVALVMVILFFFTKEKPVEGRNSTGYQEQTVDIPYEDVNKFNRRQEAEQTQIDAAARQSESRTVKITTHTDVQTVPNPQETVTFTGGSQNEDASSRKENAEKQVQSTINNLNKPEKDNKTGNNKDKDQQKNQSQSQSQPHQPPVQPTQKPAATTPTPPTP